MGELKQEAVRNGVVQSRLEQLEERIQKLQMLEGRIMSQYTAERARQSTGPMTAEPPGFTLPNAPMDSMCLPDGARMQRHSATAGLSRQNSLNSRGSDFLSPPRPLATEFGGMDDKIGNVLGFSRSESQQFESRHTTMAGGMQEATRNGASLQDDEMAVRNILRQELQGANPSIAKSHKNISKELSFVNVTDAGKESARSKDSSSTEDEIILPAKDETVKREDEDEDQDNQKNTHDSFNRQPARNLKRHLSIHSGILIMLYTHVAIVCCMCVLCRCYILTDCESCPLLGTGLLFNISNYG